MDVKRGLLRGTIVKISRSISCELHNPKDLDQVAWV